MKGIMSVNACVMESELIE